MNIPNKLTISRICLIPILIFFYLWAIPYHEFYAAGIFIIAAATDVLDGYLARKYKIITAFGKFIDPIADKLLLLSAMALLLIDPRNLHISKQILCIFLIIILGREFIVSGLRLIAVTDGVVISASWLGKLKTITQDISITLLILNNWPFRSIPMDVIFTYAALILTIWSGIDYFVKNKASLNKLKDEV